jgi:hypothetical protein
MTQNLERFEQCHLQCAILPRSILDYRLKQSAWLGAGLLEGHFARLTREPKHVDRMIR